MVSAIQEWYLERIELGYSSKKKELVLSNYAIHQLILVNIVIYIIPERLNLR